MFRELDQCTGISALQSMGSTLKGTISLLMNKICILNFLNKFRELFDQDSIQDRAVTLSTLNISAIFRDM